MAVALIQLASTVLVGILGLIGIVVQTKSKERQIAMDQKLDQLQATAKEEYKQLKIQLDNANMNLIRFILINELTKIRDGEYKPNEEQKHCLCSLKDLYNRAGGNSYVDALYDATKRDGLI